jgi:hypothetical protein
VIDMTSIQPDDGRTRREDHARKVYEVAETVAPGWERWRARIDDVTAPAREWMIDELAPRPADTS